MYHLSGEFAMGRFGLSVASLSDINYDRHDDLAVGAPYAGPDKRGVVYIYNGYNEGVLPEPSQVAAYRFYRCCHHR